MNETELLEIVCYIGKKLTQYGAEVYRVEESVNRICSAYGYTTAEVYAIPSNIVVTVYKKDR
ncbi:MAG: threonine/serine exporter family protein, partial [Oscillospiraceae bacterium]